MIEWAKPQIEKVIEDKGKQNQYIDILEEFKKQGHSGFSASYVIGYLKLYMKEPYEEIEKRLNKINKNNDYEQNLITKNILSILNLVKEYNFTKEDCNRIYRLLNWKPIVPLTGAEEEWNMVEEGLEQNKLCSAVFRYNKDNSTAHYIDGKVFSNDGGISWYTNKESYINITFPFVVPDKPEKVYLDKEGNNITNNKEKIEALKQAEIKRKEEIRKGEE